MRLWRFPLKYIRKLQNNNKQIHKTGELNFEDTIKLKGILVQKWKIKMSSKNVFLKYLQFCT